MFCEFCYYILLGAYVVDRHETDKCKIRDPKEFSASAGCALIRQPHFHAIAMWRRRAQRIKAHAKCTHTSRLIRRVVIAENELCNTTFCTMALGFRFISTRRVLCSFIAVRGRVVLTNTPRPSGDDDGSVKSKHLKKQTTTTTSDKESPRRAPE